MSNIEDPYFVCTNCNFATGSWNEADHHEGDRQHFVVAEEVEA